MSGDIKTREDVFLLVSGFYKKVRQNPEKVHVKVDQENHQEISSYHFGIWLNLWFETIDELFEGELANRAKNNARKMSSHLYLKIFQAREKAK